MLLSLTIVLLFLPLTSTKSFTACGVLIKDTNALTTFQRDAPEFAIFYIKSNYGPLQPLLIHNGLPKARIEPTIFRTMKYDCFINFHCNWETYKNTINSQNSEYENHLHSRGTFFVLQVETNTQLYKGSELVQGMRRSQRLFILTVVLNDNQDQSDWRYSKHHWRYDKDYNFYFKPSLWCANQTSVNYFRSALYTFL